MPKMAATADWPSAAAQKRGHELAGARGQDDDRQGSAGGGSVVDQRQADHHRSDDERRHADDGGVTRQRPDGGLLGSRRLDVLGDPLGRFWRSRW